VGREDLAGVEGDDRRTARAGDREDPPAGVSGTDLEVVEPAGPAQGEPAGAIGQVGAEPEVPRGAGPGGMGLRGGPVRLGGGDPSGRPVGPLLVVVKAERIELDLKLAQGPCCQLAREPAFQGLVNALDRALGLGMPGRPVLLGARLAGRDAPGQRRRPRPGLGGRRLLDRRRPPGPAE